MRSADDIDQRAPFVTVSGRIGDETAIHGDTAVVVGGRRPGTAGLAQRLTRSVACALRGILSS
jgi:hypothetical protein